MNFNQHPMHRLVGSFSIHSDEYKCAEKMTAELDGYFRILGTTEPGDLAAFDMLRRTSALLISITQHYGSIHGWTRAQHARIYTEAVRLLGVQQTEFTAPNWVEL
jgi:hypothetical protein